MWQEKAWGGGVRFAMRVELKEVSLAAVLPEQHGEDRRRAVWISKGIFEHLARFIVWPGAG